MQADFWHARWANNQIGFHLDEINPYLMRHLSRLRLQAGEQILVPLCGKTLTWPGWPPRDWRCWGGAWKRP